MTRLSQSAAWLPVASQKSAAARPVALRDLRRHRAGRQRLRNDPSLVVHGPTPPPARPRDHLDPTNPSLRLKTMLEHTHKPISKSHFG